MSDEDNKKDVQERKDLPLHENRELPQSEDNIPMPEVKPPKDENQSDTGSDDGDD